MLATVIIMFQDKTLFIFLPIPNLKCEVKTFTTLFYQIFHAYNTLQLT